MPTLRSFTQTLDQSSVDLTHSVYKDLETDPRRWNSAKASAGEEGLMLFNVSGAWQTPEHRRIAKKS